MQEESDLSLVVFAGTGLILLLLFFFAILILLYQRRVTKHKLTLSSFELQKQQELLHATITTQENERETIAGNLHDSVGQMLAAVKLNLSGIRQSIPATDEALVAALDHATKLTSESIQEVRSISHNLLPGALKDFGLAEALRVLCEKISGTELRIKFEAQGYKRNGNHAMELALYRISQELINNALKYAEASQINFSLTEDAGCLQYAYSDNGKGFNMEKLFTDAKSKGLGFRNIESRVKMIGGTYSLSSAPGMGVQVKISVDLQQGTLL